MNGRSERASGAEDAQETFCPSWCVDHRFDGDGQDVHRSAEVVVPDGFGAEGVEVHLSSTADEGVSIVVMDTAFITPQQVGAVCEAMLRGAAVAIRAESDLGRFNADLVDVIREAMREVGIEIPTLVGLLGSSAATLQARFSYRSAFTLTELILIAEILGVRASDLARQAERRDDPNNC